MAGKFEVFEDQFGKWRFRLKDSAGDVVASGQGYPSAAQARKGCELLLKSARGAPIVEVDR